MPPGTVEVALSQQVQCRCATHVVMASSASFSIVGSPLAENWAQNRVSAVYICFPGMCTME